MLLTILSIDKRRPDDVMHSSTMITSCLVLCLLVIAFVQHRAIASEVQGYDFTLPEPDVMNSIHKNQRIELRNRPVPQARTRASASRFREVLSGLGYILSGDTKRLDHLSRPAGSPNDAEQSIGYDSQLNDRLLFGTRKRDGESAGLYLFENRLEDWH